MKKNLKLLILCTLAVCSFSMPHGVWGMEELPASTQDNKRPRTMVFSDDQTCPEEAQEKKRKLGEVDEFILFELSKEIVFHILKYVAFSGDGSIGKLSAVCKTWENIITKDKVAILTFAISERFPSYQEVCNWCQIDPKTCERFLNGKLIYKPNTDNDTGMVKLPIVDLANPLEGTFDLSKCGDAGQHLSILTGHRKRKKAENANKLEIWFVPRFLVEKEIGAAAKHLSAIFPSKWSDSIPVGLFWTLGDLDDMRWYDYLTTENMEKLSKIDLCANWHKAATIHDAWLELFTTSDPTIEGIVREFRVSFAS